MARPQTESRMTALGACGPGEEDWPSRGQYGDSELDEAESRMTIWERVGLGRFLRGYGNGSMTTSTSRWLVLPGMSTDPSISGLPGARSDSPFNEEWRTIGS